MSERQKIHLNGIGFQTELELRRKVAALEAELEVANRRQDRAEAERDAAFLDAALIAETTALATRDVEGVIASHEWWLGLAEGRRVAARLIRAAAEAAQDRASRGEVGM